MRISCLFFLLCFGFQAVAQKPVITNFSPFKGDVGTTVMITGTGFDAIATNNIVFFGGIKAVVNSATSSQLTVSVPLGAMFAPITVLNKTSLLSASSLASFTPTFSVANKKTMMGFDTKIDFSVGTKPVSEAIGDLDGDGKLDIAVLNNNNNTVSVLRNIGSNESINFATKVDFATGSNPQSVTMGDFDGDGKFDLLVTNMWDNTVSIYLNTSTTGNINFASRINYSSDVYPAYAAIGDFDNDGKSDIAVANYIEDYVTNECTITILRNTSNAIGNINFSYSPKLVTGKKPLSIVVGDLNVDGKVDLGVANWQSNTVSIFTNSSSLGNINFYTKFDIATNEKPLFLAIGDVDGDSRLDIAVANANSVSVFQNYSLWNNLAFSIKKDFNPVASPVSLAIGEINGDGKPDIAVATTASNGNQLSIFYNASTTDGISFDPREDLTTGTSPYQVLIADMNGDRKLDLVTANYGSNTVSVLKNTPSFVNSIPPPSISSFSPLSAKVGATVTINGTGFSTTNDNNIVFFGGIRAKVLTASSAKLEVEVPFGASYAAISVLNKSNTQVGFSQLKFNPVSTISKSKIVSKDYIASSFINTGDNSARETEIADIDGDGKLDLLFVNSDFENPFISVLRNIGIVDSVAFASPVYIKTSSLPTKLKIADLDNDGNLDLIVIDRFENKFSIYRNTSTIGAIRFNNQISYTLRNFQPSAIGVSDLDGDGFLDVALTMDHDATANNETDKLFILRNLGDMLFSSITEFSVGRMPNDIEIGDLNGDSKPDLIISSNYQTNFSVIKNACVKGVIQFSNYSEYTTTSLNGNYFIGKPLALGDLNNDGKLDLTVIHSDSLIAIYKNSSINGLIQFDNKIVYKAGRGAQEVSFGDMNGDGKTDLAVANFGNKNKFLDLGNISLFKNVSNGNDIIIDNSQTIFYFGFYRTMDVADMDGDGRLDLIGISTSNSANIFSYKPIFPITINSFSPIKGTNGTSVTIEGYHFNPINSNNIVYFGNIKATIITATDTKLVVKVPAGVSYAPISVLNLAKGMIGVSKNSFMPLFSPPKTAITKNDFNSNIDIETGRAPSSIASGDFDGDGLLDLVTANYFANSISILRKNSNSGSIGYESNLDITTGTTPQFVLVADMNEDGKLDIIVANSGDNNITVLMNMSTGVGNINFDTKYNFSTGENPNAIAVSDFDMDGQLDLVVINQRSNNLTVLLNNGIGDKVSFRTGVNYTTGQDPKGIAVGDINNDNAIDIVVTNQGSRSVSVLNNNGSGIFNPKVDYNTGVLPSSIALGDLNDDGLLDLVITHMSTSSSGPPNVTTLKNTSGVFSSPISYATEANPYAVALADLDGDTKIDIVVANNISSTLNIFKNISTTNSIQLNDKVTIPSSINPASIHIADADGDGRPDLITPTTSLFGTTIGIAKNVYPLTIFASNQLICDTKSPLVLSNNYSVQGLVNGHEVAGIKLTSTGTAASALPGTYPIIPANAVGMGLNNYKITYINGILTKEAPIPGIRMTPMDVSMNVNNKLQLNARNLGLTGVQYNWMPFSNLNNSGIPNPIATISKQEEYKVEMKTAAGCVTVDTVLVRVHTDKAIYVPNAFSPNGDGVNDILKVNLVGFSRLNNFVVYNSFGYIIYNSNDINRGWDGRDWWGIRAGTYRWYVSATDANNQVTTKTGSVLLVR